jgi:HTH-type transcriptional regulator / antitoxin HigA
VVARRPAEAFPPGDFLREELEERKWTPTDLATMLDRPVRVINEIIAGKRAITPETARGLAEAFGSSPEYWLNLEASFQAWRAGDGEGDMSTAIG